MSREYKETKGVYLSKIKIGRELFIKNNLHNEYNYHKVLWHGFNLPNGSPAPFLYRRIDDNIYVYSSINPSRDGIWKNAKTIFIDATVVPSNLMFNIKINPTRMVRDENGRPKTVAILEKDKIEKWLIGNLAGADCQLTGNDIVISNPRLEIFRKNNDTIKVATCIVNGTITSNNKQKLVGLLSSGMGSAKRFGNGMLLIEKAK